MKTKTKTRKPSQNGRAKKTPDLMDTLSKAQRHVEKKPPTADQLADCFEAESKKLQGIADILRGKS
jgi:hypothetical protein